MWVTKSLDRARRRLLPGADVDTAPDASEAAASAPAIPDPDAVDDLMVSLPRPELERLIKGLARSIDPNMPRPDSPALLAGALTTAINRIGGRGRPLVTRSPAGLYTPEYWQIRIEGADGRTRDAIGRLTAGGRIR